MSGLQDILATAPLFKNFVENDLLALASAMRERQLADGATLFRQGQHGDAMVLVVAGELLILAEEDEGKTVELARIGVGDIVGEMSALDPAPRSATVKADGPATVYVLDRTMLGAVMNNAPSVYASLLKGVGRAVMDRLDRTNKRVRSEAFAHIDVFDGPINAPEEASGQLVQKNLDPQELKALKDFNRKEREQLLAAAPIISFERGDVLCAEGKPGHTCFIILAGEVEVLRHAGDEEHRLATLGPGAVVGQLALLHDAPRSATVRSLGPLWVVAIGRGSFNRLLSTHSAVGMRMHEQVIVAGIRQLRIASRMLTEMRIAQEEVDAFEEQPEAPADPMTHRLNQIERPAQRPSAPSAPRAPTPERRKPARSAPPERERQTSKPFASELARRARQAWQAVDGGGHETQARQAKKKKKPTRQMALYVTAAMSEWGLSLTDLDDIQVSVPPGQITAAELRARKGR